MDEQNPKAGGRWVRDPDTGELTRATEETAPETGEQETKEKPQ